jgi:hypothetical protein
VSFGAVQHILSASFNGYAMGIGFFEREKMTLCPAMGFAPMWHSGHRIIIIVRLPKGAEYKHEGSIDHGTIAKENLAAFKKFGNASRAAMRLLGP